MVCKESLHLTRRFLMMRLHFTRNLRRAASLVVGLLLTDLAPPLTFAQPEDGKAQPDRITLGTVHVGATVEASVRVLIRGDDTTGIEVKIAPPPFLRVTQTRLGTQTYGNLGTFIFCDVFVSLNTAQAGDRDGELLFSGDG